MRLGLVAVIAVLTISTTAHAERLGKRRALHLGAIVLGGTTYIVVEAVAKPALVPDDCRWCNPPELDAHASDLLIWSDTGLADSISDATGFYLAPASALGLLMLSGEPIDWLDDFLPVIESAIATGLFHHLVKFVAGRERPFVHHADPTREPELDDDMSFFSGHTATAFALATSAGQVARMRGYRLEPVIWASGLVLATTTGYLRIAADRHWLSDVTTGALVGSVIGLALPRLLHSETLTVAPTGTGVVVAGVF